MTPLQQILLDKGYKIYKCGSYKTYHSTDTLFQKCIRDKDGRKMYYINLWYYPDRNFGNNCNFPESFQAEVQFTLKGDSHLNVTSFYKEVESVEAQMLELWTKMEFDYYE